MSPQLPIELPLAVTPLYAGLAGLLMLMLAARVVWVRYRKKVIFGDGDDVDLQRAIRVHGNSVEYVPLILILMAVAELGGAAPGMVHAVGSAMVGARILFALGLSRTSGSSAGRGIGIVLTWAALLAAAVLCLTVALG